MPVFAIVVILMIRGHVLVVDALSGFPIDLMELERASRVARGIDFDRETDQRNGNLSGPIRACHRRTWMQGKP
jgi:hypothetical protein